MASAVAVKEVPVVGLKLLPDPPSAPEKPVASALSLVNTKGELSRRDDDDASEKPVAKDTVDDRLALDLPVAKRFSTDALGLLQLMGLMGDGGAASGHGWWVSKEDDAALQLKVAMPGVGKEHVKVTADKNILLIKGEGVKDPEDGKGPAQYSRRIQLPAEAFKMDQIKAEMNDGVLKVIVPKIKDEERKDVFQIKVE